MFRLYLSHFGSDFRPVHGDVSITVGRSPTCDIRVSHSNVSREHCRVAARGSRFTLTDCNSLNGTLVNGEMMMPGTTVFIDDGDTIQVGRVLLVCRIEKQAAA